MKQTDTTNGRTVILPESNLDREVYRALLKTLVNSSPERPVVNSIPPAISQPHFSRAEIDANGRGRLTINVSRAEFDPANVGDFDLPLIKGTCWLERTYEGEIVLAWELAADPWVGDGRNPSSDIGPLPSLIAP